MFSLINSSMFKLPRVESERKVADNKEMGHIPLGHVQKRILELRSGPSPRLQNFNKLSDSILIRQTGQVKGCVEQFEKLFKEEPSPLNKDLSEQKILEKEIDVLENEKVENIRRNCAFSEMLETEKVYKEGLDKLAAFKEIYRENEDEWLKLVKSYERKNLKACFDRFFELVGDLRMESDEIFGEINSLPKEADDAEFAEEFEKFLTKFQSADLSLFGDYAEIHTEIARIFNLYHAKDPSHPLDKEINKAFSKEIDPMLDFGDYLITPVQRMPRYEMLLKDMKKRSSDQSVALSKLNKALDVANEANLATNARLTTNFLARRSLTEQEEARLKKPELFTPSKKYYLDICTKNKVLNWRSRINERKLIRETNRMKKFQAKQFQSKLNNK